MKPKTMILMGLAVTCGLGASYMTSQLLAQRNEQPPEVEKIEILVAKKPLNVADHIKNPEEVFEKKLVVAEEAPRDAIREYDVLKNKIMKQNLRKGDHITTNELYGDGDTLPIPEGYKAVGLRVNLEQGLSGFGTLPHSRVNINITVRKQDDRGSFSAILLQDVLVLAADTTVDRQGISAPASIVTFALKDDDVLKINLAKDMGSLTLSLRKPNDHSITEFKKITFDQLFGKELAKPEEHAKVVPPSPAPAKVVAQPKEDPRGPEGTLHDLVIISGDRQQRTTYLLTPDGRSMEQGTQGDAPAPARKQQPAAPKAKGGPQDF